MGCYLYLAVFLNSFTVLKMVRTFSSSVSASLLMQQTPVNSWFPDSFTLSQIIVSNSSCDFLFKVTGSNRKLTKVCGKSSRNTFTSPPQPNSTKSRFGISAKAFLCLCGSFSQYSLPQDCYLFAL